MKKTNLAQRTTTPRRLVERIVKSDHELLELAAKAAGLHIDKSKSNGGPTSNTGFDLSGNVVLDWHNGTTWNPLTHDGDALRLAVKMGFELYHSINNDRWSVFVGYPKGQRIVYEIQEYGDDEYAATRRTIVRAAAAIGWEMP